MKGKSNLSSAYSGKSDTIPVSHPKEILFSFKDFDSSQGQTFLQWERSSLLAIMLDKLKEYSRKTIMEARKASLRVYGSFPVHSRFYHPRHVAEDAIWASLHIQGKECIAGHLIGNIFYVVFLDKEHEFWKTEKKHT